MRLAFVGFRNKRCFQNIRCPFEPENFFWVYFGFPFPFFPIVKYNFNVWSNRAQQYPPRICKHRNCKFVNRTFVRFALFKARTLHNIFGSKQTFVLANRVRASSSQCHLLEISKHSVWHFCLQGPRFLSWIWTVSDLQPSFIQELFLITRWVVSSILAKKGF